MGPGIMCRGHELHVMGGKWSAIVEAVIGEVSSGFGDGTESWGQVGPAHGQEQRDGKQLGFIIIGGHCDGQA